MNCNAVDIVYLYVKLRDYVLVLFDCKHNTSQSPLHCCSD